MNPERDVAAPGAEAPATSARTSVVVPKPEEKKAIVALAGRRIDPAGQDERFPEAGSAAVKAGIKRTLRTQKVGTVLASAACGADILALEAAVELELQVHIILPFARERFRTSSVIDGGGEWGARFDALLDTPNPRRVLVVLPSDVGGNDDDAYDLVNKQLLKKAQALALHSNVDPIALAIWDRVPRADKDATQAFKTGAEQAAMKVVELSTLPLRDAEAFLSGADQDPDSVLDLREDLVRSQPRLANRLARELALRFLTAKKRMPTRAVDRLWKACKEVEAFGYARRILKRRLDRSNQIIDEQYAEAPNALTLRQQRALCTSKDPDLSASVRHQWAIEILDPDGEPGDSEHQGIAGGIWKRRWEWDGSRASLERSLEHYRNGMPQDGISPAGYVEINCAFVLDLLASLVRDDTTAASHTEQADKIRKTLVAQLQSTKKNLWAWASLAEAHLGLNELEQAKEALSAYVCLEPASWEVETTLRQLVRLANLRSISMTALRSVLEVAFHADNPNNQAALSSILIGRVGLALSGGGFRASLYHLGVLARLAESDVLRHVEALSCVSGGSIVGALYYLSLRQELGKHGEALNRDGYIRVVSAIIDDFVQGVSRNVRTRVLASFSNSYAIVSGNNRAYAECVAKLFHETFYAKLEPKGLLMQDLLIQPGDAPENFNPARHNWMRKNKVPTLVINAATLNTGHSWQFTARSMGESPFSLVPEVDSNPRLRRPNYHAEIADRSVRLQSAVAASACVPGMFAPLELDKLYPGYKVQLVDGGVFDNQGATSLVEQDCQVLFISDAAGQLFGETVSENGHVSPLLRSVSVFQERIRQSGYENLRKRKDAGQLRGMAYTHLTQGLRAAPVDWDRCEDPLQQGDQLPDSYGGRSGTGDGVDKDIQLYLAKMRTDLDVFSQVECAALMASGYVSMDSQLSKLGKELPALETQRSTADWFFSRLLPVIRGQEHDPVAFGRLKEQLEASSSGVGRSFRLDKTVQAVVIALAGTLAVGLGALAWLCKDRPLVTVSGVVLLALGFLVPALLGSWSAFLINPKRVFTRPLYGALVALLMALVAQAILRWVDPRYLKRGSLERLFQGA